MNEHVTKDKVWFAKVGEEDLALVWWEHDTWVGQWIIPWEGRTYGWEIEIEPELTPNYSEIPPGICGGCDGPVMYDYLCARCRDGL